MTARDMRYGRQGGRMVPWGETPHRFPTGAKVALRPIDPMEPFVLVELLAHEQGGYATVRFESGATLAVAESRLHEPSEIDPDRWAS